MPLAPRTARAVDLAIGERCEGPVFRAADGRLLDRHNAARIVRQVARRAGIIKPVGPHTLRHAFITAALDAGVPLRASRRRRLTPTREPQCGTTGPGPPSTGTPPTSWLPTSPELHGSPTFSDRASRPPRQKQPGRRPPSTARPAQVSVNRGRQEQDPPAVDPVLTAWAHMRTYRLSAGPGTGNRRLLPVTAAHDYDDLHHLVDRLSPRRAERLRVLVASDPELASAAQPEAQGKGEHAGQRRPSVIGIWESGRSDLSERHDEIIRRRLKRPA